jgi:hypothetical protein
MLDATLLRLSGVVASRITNVAVGRFLSEIDMVENNEQRSIGIDIRTVAVAMTAVKLISGA